MNTEEFDEFDDEELEAEFEISIEPKEDVLEAAGISPDDFEEALMKALEKREELEINAETEDQTFAELEDTPLEIKGTTYRLGDLAVIEVGPVTDDEDEEEEEEEEFGD